MDKTDMDKCEAVCKDLLSKVMTDVSAQDIETLEQMKKIYKKAIPFSKRMYVASYLLKKEMEREEGKTFSSKMTAAPRRAPARLASKGVRTSIFQKSGGTALEREDFTSTAANNNMEQRAKEDALHQRGLTSEAPLEGAGQDAVPTKVSVYETSRVVIDEDKAATIFVSIGKARRVFPRDLVGLFVNAAGLDRDRVGDIRVLPNYSFVQIYKDDAEKAIAALNGYKYKGKILAVSYSRGKGDAEGTAHNAATGIAASAAVAPETGIAAKEVSKSAFAAGTSESGASA